MAIDLQNARELLRKLDLNRLFVEELNWSNPGEGAVSLTVDDQKFTLKPVAEQADLGVFEVRDPGGDGIPDLAVRKKIHKLVSDRHKYEHILVFVNRPQTTTLWSWLRREDGKAPRPNEHRFHVDQPGDSLLQRLEGLAFDWDELDEDGRATIIQVTDKVREQFSRNAEQVTKKFYDEFQRQHDRFLKFITGIDDLRDNEWYASVMLNRLMFIYFIQCRRFLDGDPAYLKNRLTCCQMEGVPFYRNFLVPLFFYGFATDKEERSEETRQLLGDIPYLNGGLFMPHEIERGGSDKDPTPETIAIDIPDEAFEQLFSFFDRYQWHLDDRPLRNDNEINPDVLGYIFEKYINQKQMGAYYTKEDITEYISRNTVLPFLFDKLRSQRWDAVVPLPIPDIEPYIFEAVRRGVDLDLPDYIAAGIDDVSQRGRWNEAADPEFALPTETWREHIHRRERVQRIREAFANGEITEINDFITHNLDIVAFTHDFLYDTDDPLVILNFYFNCLKQATILDPTCGSGAFLFAALNLLEPLYEICLQRMEEFLASKQRHRQWASDFERELADLKKHPSRNYFIYKSIIVNNLFGVDIMEEAVEICKLRLFLKLASQVDDPERIEPLPDIDFNILAGNTLVGYATYEQILEAKQPGATGSGQMDFTGIVDRVKSVDHKIRQFRGLQMAINVDSHVLREQKQNLSEDLQAVKLELDQDLAAEYGFKPSEFDRFIESHKPFHWYVEFNEILTRTPGGFDVVIGNPPFVQYRTIKRDYSVRAYRTQRCDDLFAFVLERSQHLQRIAGRTGFIIPLSAFSTDGMLSLQEVETESMEPLHISHYSGDSHPARLFEEAEKRLTIVLGRKKSDPERSSGVLTSGYMKWCAVERPLLFNQKVGYAPQRTEEVRFFDTSLPKLGHPLEVSIAKKLLRKKTRTNDFIHNRGNARIFYTRKIAFFLQFTDFVPLIVDAKGTKHPPSELKELFFDSELAAKCFLSVFSSNLFYWFVTVNSDCRNLNRREVTGLPIAYGEIQSETRRDLAALSELLMETYQRHSEMKTATYRDRGRLSVQYLKQQPAKPVIDEIDRLLAGHYALNDEETDFIVSYMEKYRMGLHSH